MKFQDLLIAAIERSEIPLRFEPGAGEAVAKSVTDALKTWITAHLPAAAGSDFDAGYRALAIRLLAEVEGGADVPE